MLKNVFKKLKVKKIVKICSYILVFLVFIVLLAEISLRYFLPLPSVKTKILDKVSSVIGAKLTAGEISAGLLWIEIDNVALDTGKDSLLTCKSLKVRQNLLKILKGQVSLKHIYVDEPVLKIIRYKDGSFNFDTLLSQEEKPAQDKNETAGGVPLDLRIKTLNLNNAKITYLDLKDDIKASIEKLHLTVNDFSFYEPFDVNFSFIPYFEQKGLVIDDSKIALSANINLNGLNLKEASLNLKQLAVHYKEALLKLTDTKVNNFENPSVVFDMELKDFSNETLRAFAETPEFNLSSLKAKGSLDYLIKKEKLNIKDLTLTSDETEISFKGNLNFAKEFSTKGKITLKSVLESLSELYPPLQEYKPEGQLSADFDFSWPLELSGKCDLTDVGFFVEKAGTFEDINTSVEVKTIDDIKIEELKGILNKNPFMAKVNYQKKKNYADVFFDFKADKLYLVDSSEKKEETSAAEGAEQTTQTETAQDNSEKSSFVPININAKVDIAKLDAPYIKGNKVIFKANAKNITSQMDQTHGTFELNIHDGQIKDVYTISNANSLTKVMFMSLSVVSKVINTLNVLDLLSGMGKLITGKKIDESDEDEVIAHQKINGKLDFDSFQTLVDFDDGLATMKKCFFVSNLFSFRVNGKINFNDRKIKLNVDSAPGKHTEDGIMPLNIDVKGTVEEPDGSLSVISSVSSLVSDTVMNNPVSNILKSTWSKLFSSKEEAPSEEQEEENALTPEETEGEPEKENIQQVQNATENIIKNTAEAK